ncbi:hypothetical protein CP533_4275 [Ophiocordyceps camponoti-saundersi (nom. inval.)]|nr:hypothetical protein CP533_4275 [Ophiocordyceps camponoti-saundersi (nom. inval.)]
MDSSYKVQSLFEVKNLVAVVTGGGSGLGRVITHALAANGAKAIYILGRREDALNKTRDSSSHSHVIHPVVCDVTSKDALEAAAERVRKEVGYCDVVLANSGIATAMLEDSVLKKNESTTVKDVQQSLWKPSMDEFTKTLHVNVTAVFFTVVAFLDLLDEGNKRAVVTQKSQVIIMSSIAGFARIVISSYAYAASKAAAIQLGKQLATAFAQFKIRVNVIAPGVYPSEMTDDTLLKGNSNPREEGGMPKGSNPLERSGTEEEMAGVALFLTSAAGGYLDGSVLMTDGGRTCIVPATY